MSMTENEALKRMKMCIGVSPSENIISSFKLMSDALDELQQYRAIGTLEQLKTMFDGYWKLKDLCEEYEKYGLPEDYWKLNEMCKDYSAIGTIEEFKALKEKSVPVVTGEWIDTQPQHNNGYYKNAYVCSNCNDYYTTEYDEMKFCPNCGAKMTET